jgi:hypothetical protein
MHCYASGVIGTVLAIGCIIFSRDPILALVYSPLVISGTIIALALLPTPRRRA